MNEASRTIPYPVKKYLYRVFYADTDAGGVMYYAQYLRIFEQARMLYMEDHDISPVALARENCLFACRKAEIEYRSPALLGDILEVETRIDELTRSYLTFYYSILCPSRLDHDGMPVKIADGATKMVACRNMNGQVVLIRIPNEIMTRFQNERPAEK